jgi:division protein CdvB (Snf7/Vps24/ESCRT-III family)
VREYVIKNPLRGHASPNFEELVTKAVPKLKSQKFKLGQVIIKLTRRDEILFKTCATELKAKNEERAAIFANELAEIRKLTKVLYHTQILVERIILRLETLKEFNAAFADLKPVLRNLKTVTKSLSSFMPQMAYEMERVNETIIEVMTSCKIDTSKLEVPTDVKTPGGEEVLKEVAEMLEEQINEKLPEPPTSAPVMEKPQPQRVEKRRQMVALTASCSEVSESSEPQKYMTYKDTEMKQFSWTTVGDSSLEDTVLQYAKKREGQIDITQCAHELNVAIGEVEKALETLGVKGKIKIEAWS